MADTNSLFGNFKLCRECSRPLSHSYEEECCPACLERQLFSEVKEYIRTNTVNEHDVAQHFHIPLKQVKYWIREGRIEYKTDSPDTNISAIHCQVCGAAIRFGNMCSRCTHAINTGRGYSITSKNNKDSKMRYIDQT